MAKQLVPINGSVLRWAREEVGLSEEEFAEAVKVDPSEVYAWERGQASPSKGSFSNIVRTLRRPSALFFLPQPPRSAGLPTSFRKAPGLGTHRLTRDEVQQIRWARRLQDIISWVIRDADQDPVAIARYTLEDDATTVGLTERQRAGVTTSDQLGWESAREAFQAWRHALESKGLLVFQLSLGDGNIRGFSAWDDFAPVMAVNTSYHPTARIYSMAHEYGHLLTRTDAACLRFVMPSEPSSRLERWCERFAASFLLPADALRIVASEYGVSEMTPTSDVQLVRRIADQFKVSTRATSIRLQELDMAPPSLYPAVEKLYASLDWNPKGRGGRGQTAPEKRLGQLGPTVPATLFEAADAGRLSRRDLSDYLGLTTGQVSDLQALVQR